MARPGEARTQLIGPTLGPSAFASAPVRGGVHGPRHDDLRVAICAAGELWGGVERFIVALSTGLRRAGHDPLILLFNDALLAARLRDEGLRPQIVAGAGKYDLRQIAAVGRALSAHGSNILHTHGYRATIVGGVASWTMPLKVVSTEHGRLEPLDGWRQAGGYAKLAANRWLERLVSRATVDATVYVSEEIASSRRSAGRGATVQVIRNGLDPSGLPPSGAAQPRVPGFHIGIVGRLVKVKGHEILLDAMRYLSDRRDIHLHVFGTGPLDGQYEARARRNGVADRVTFHGFCGDIAARMRGLDVLAMPSLHEGLPYTLLEALYLRVPVVASAVGGLREVIDHDRSGLLVPPGNARSLAAALERLYRDPPLRRRLGEAGHALVCDGFLADRMVQEYTTLYRRLAVG